MEQLNDITWVEDHPDADPKRSRQIKIETLLEVLDRSYFIIYKLKHENDIEKMVNNTIQALEFFFK